MLTRKVTVAPCTALSSHSGSTTSMDPELVKGLQQIKKFLDDGTFSQQDFDKQKSALLDVYPVARPGPTLGGVPTHQLLNLKLRNLKLLNL